MIEPTIHQNRQKHATAAKPLGKGLQIAIVGIACRLPGVDSVESFWTTYGDGLSEKPVDPPSTFFPKLRAEGLKSVSEGQDPELAWFLDGVQDALDDAEITDQERQRIETILGRSRTSRSISRTGDVSLLFEFLKSIYPHLTNNNLDALRSEIERDLGIRPVEYGIRSNEPTLTVDSGRASSLVAVDLACKGLIERRADIAIAGASHLGSEGEGLGIVVLKRLADAERNGDRIYSVVQAIGGSSINSQSGEPRSRIAKGYRQAIRRMYRASGMTPSRVELVESGTTRDELRALSSVFEKSASKPPVWSDITSSFGDESPVAGMVGLIHASLSIHHRRLPGNGLFESARPTFQNRHAERRAQPWIRSEPSQPRRGAVSAFAPSGLSLHAVLEEHRKFPNGRTSGLINNWETEAILLDAPNRDSWIGLAQALIHWLDARENHRVALKDLAFTLNLNPARLPVRAGLVVSSTSQLRERLASLIEKVRDPKCQAIRDGRGVYFCERPPSATPKLAFLFPGEGSQYPGMLGDLASYFPEIMASFETSDRIARERGHAARPSDEIFQWASGTNDSGLFSTVAAVNIVLSAQLGLYRLITRLRVRPDAVVGHSSGEFLAMAAAGIFPVDEGLEDRLGRLGSIFESLDAKGAVPKAKLLAVSTDRRRVEAAIERLELESSTTIAMDNCPHQVIVAGLDSEIDKLSGHFKSAGILNETLPFDRAYHTERFRFATGPIADFFREQPLRKPSIPIYSCFNSRLMPGDPSIIRQLAVDQWSAPVAFRQTIEAMYGDGIRLFVEVGVRGNLSGFVSDILRGKPHVAIASNLPRRSGMTQLNHLVATLHAEGVELRPDELYTMRAPRKVDLSKDLPPPLIKQPLELGRDERSTEWFAKLRAMIAATTVVPEPITNVKPSDESADSAFLSFLKTMDDFLETQRSVVEAYLQSPREDDLAIAKPARKRLGPDIEHAEPNGPIPEWLPAIDTERDGSVVNEASLDFESILLGEVSKRTGYPLEILGLDLDMEAELGIDSIKRVEILGELREHAGLTDEVSFEKLARCQTLGAILEVLNGRHQRQNVPPRSEPQWLGEVVEWVPGERFVGRRLLDQTRDPIAREHTLGGRRISSLEPDRLGLPVVPFTVMIEMLAQAAIVLDPSRVVAGFRDVQAHRWIPYESNPSTLEFEALRRPEQPGHVAVKIWDRGGNGSDQGTRLGSQDRPSVEGVVVLAEGCPEGLPPLAYHPGTAVPCRFTAQQLYDEQWLFHGPALQALKRVGLSSATAIEGSLEVLPRRAVLPESEWPRLHTDPIVLDAYTHLLGCWGLDKKAGETGDLMFPLKMARLDLFGDEPAEGSEIVCRIQIQEVSRHQVKVNAELVGPDGLAWVRIEGWEDWRFYWPDRFRDVCRDPRQVLIGKRLPLPGAPSKLSAVWVEPPADMLRPIWGDVIEWIHLSSNERTAHVREHLDVKARSRSLLGKIAAKEGARRLWLDLGEEPVFPADLEIETDSQGRQSIRSRLVDRDSQIPTPMVAFAAIDGIGIGVASVDSRDRLGVDLELISGRMGRVSIQESDWLDRELADRDEKPEWLARFQTAKRAAERSEQPRRSGSESSSEVVRVDWESGTLVVSTEADIAESQSRRVQIRVFTAKRGEVVWAWTLGERVKQTS